MAPASQFLAALPHPAALVSVEWRVLWANAAFGECFPADALEPAGGLARRRDEVEQRVRAGETWEGELSTRDASGRLTQWVVWVWACEQAGPGAWGLLAIDRTERRRNEEERSKQDRLESLGRLAGGIAHDLNNLLFVVSGNLELAELQAGEDSTASKSIAKASAAVDRARDFSRRMLTFAKGGDPRREPVDLAPLLRIAVRFALQESQVQVVFRLGDALPTCLVDEGQFSQVIDAVVANARHAMDDSGKLEVSAATEFVEAGNRFALPPGEYARVDILDNGPGIPADVLPKVFDPYFTTRHDGAGLGLTTAFSILKRHGGAISVASPADGGACVTLLLPTAPRPASDVASQAAAPRPAPARILVIDDDPAVSDLVCTMLQALGYAAEAVPEGGRGCELWERALSQGQPFRAALIDGKIPGGLGGAEALEALRRVDPAARAVLLTGYSEKVSAADCRRHGFHGALSKPVSLAELSRALARLLE